VYLAKLTEKKLENTRKTTKMSMPITALIIIIIIIIIQKIKTAGAGPGGKLV
jgi:hypothetical protein